MIGVGRAGPRGSATAPATVAAAPAAAASTPVSAAPSSTERRGWSGIDLATLDPEAERPYWIAISLIPGVGPVGFARILERFGSARAAWAAGAELLSCLPRVPPDAAAGLRRLRRSGATATARRVETEVRRAGGVVLTVLDPGYPAALRATQPRPAVLYRAGDAAAFEAPAVAVVGTRRATGYGRASAQEIGDELARAGVTVVSGLALGVDGEAHAAALDAGGRSVAVLPSPLDRIFHATATWQRGWWPRAAP